MSFILLKHFVFLTELIGIDLGTQLIFKNHPDLFFKIALR